MSAEVTAADTGEMLEQAREIAGWHPNVVIKLPTTTNGLRAMRAFAAEDRAPINATVIFSAGQAVAAASAGASYVSPFVGARHRSDLRGPSRRGEDNLGRAAQPHQRHRVVEGWRPDLHMAFAVLEQLLRHPLTEEAVDLFSKDWERLQESAKVRALQR